MAAPLRMAGFSSDGRIHARSSLDGSSMVCVQPWPRASASLISNTSAASSSTSSGSGAPSVLSTDTPHAAASGWTSLKRQPDEASSQGPSACMAAKESAGRPAAVAPVSASPRESLVRQLAEALSLTGHSLPALAVEAPSPPRRAAKMRRASGPKPSRSALSRSALLGAAPSQAGVPAPRAAAAPLAADLAVAAGEELELLPASAWGAAA
mmetsp:Transcript_2846/g.11507  ORF Transcript_2846/g.11507 Transcript_2846/m.11507 type:complete len:210 (+) Transcript_2846:635-1264(+)